MINELLERLEQKQRRGSKPRCHLLTHGAPDQVADRLTSLVTPFAEVSADDHWMPEGFDNPKEAELDKAPHLLEAQLGEQLAKWWLPPGVGRRPPGGGRPRRTPNFDIASTCTIDGKRGLLLVEAKAHDKELMDACAGRHQKSDASNESNESHQSIGAAIQAASAGLEEATSRRWSLERDSHYQMSNRFAWSWKICDLGLPVVLVYLGFLGAEEMRDRGTPLVDHAAWEQLVYSHSKSLCSSEIWNRQWMVSGVPMVPLVRSTQQALNY